MTPKDGEYAIDLLIIAKYYERIADHAVKYCKMGDLFRYGSP